MKKVKNLITFTKNILKNKKKNKLYGDPESPMEKINSITYFYLKVVRIVYFLTCISFLLIDILSHRAYNERIDELTLLILLIMCCTMVTELLLNVYSQEIVFMIHFFYCITRFLGEYEASRSQLVQFYPLDLIILVPFVVAFLENIFLDVLVNSMTMSIALYSIVKYRYLSIKENDPRYIILFSSVVLVLSSTIHRLVYRYSKSKMLTDVREVITSAFNIKVSF